MAHDDFLDSTLEVTVTTDRDTLLKKARATGQAILIVLNGSRIGHRAVLAETPFTIGRGATAGLQLEGDAISRVHARVVMEDGEYVLVDEGSTNGSFVNYAKIRRSRLSDGDEVQIGHVLLKFLSGDNIETAYHEEYRKLVRRDALTGALNRPTFDEELRVSLRKAESGKQELCLILFDLDHFKEVNDSWGHTAGDLVLRAVGGAVEKAVSAPHIFARVGGEEFAIIYFGPADATLSLAHALRESIERLEVPYEGTTIKVTTSLGVACASDGATLPDLYQSADKRLYLAKKSGRNRVVAGKLGDDAAGLDGPVEDERGPAPRSAR